MIKNSDTRQIADFTGSLASDKADERFSGYILRVNDQEKMIYIPVPNRRGVFKRRIVDTDPAEQPEEKSSSEFRPEPKYPPYAEGSPFSLKADTEERWCNRCQRPWIVSSLEYIDKHHLCCGEITTVQRRALPSRSDPVGSTLPLITEKQAKQQKMSPPEDLPSKSGQATSSSDTPPKGGPSASSGPSLGPPNSPQMHERSKKILQANTRKPEKGEDGWPKIPNYSRHGEQYWRHKITFL